MDINYAYLILIFLAALSLKFLVRYLREWKVLRRIKIITQNYTDFAQYKKLSAILQHNYDSAGEAYPVLEKNLGDWILLGIEAYSCSRHKNLYDKKMNLNEIFFANSDGLKSSHGAVYPYVFNNCRILRLKNNQQEILHAFLPGPNVQRQCLLQQKNIWLDKISDKSYVGETLSNLFKHEHYLAELTRHQELISGMKFLCEKETEEAPVRLQLYGKEVGQNAVFVTALKLGAKTEIVFPSGLFKQIEYCVNPIFRQLKNPKTTFKLEKEAV